LLEVLYVELPQSTARGDRALVDVPGAAHDGVISGEHGIEVLAVDVVEAGAALAYPSLGDERPEEQGRLRLRRVELSSVVPGCARHEHSLAGLDLLEQLPREQWHAEHVHETE